MALEVVVVSNVATPYSMLQHDAEPGRPVAVAEGNRDHDAADILQRSTTSCNTVQHGAAIRIGRCEGLAGAIEAVVPVLLGFVFAQFPGPPGPDGPDGVAGKPGVWGHIVRPAPPRAPVASGGMPLYRFGMPLRLGVIC